MGTWSSHRAPLDNEPDLDFQALTDGENIYWYFTSGSTSGLVEYDPVGDTETVIVDEATSPDIHFIYSYTLFNSDVYVVCQQTSTFDPCVYKYDGTPNNWTLVDKLRVGATAGTYALIFSNDSHVVVVHVDYNGAYTTVGRHSTDGSSWSDSTFDTTPIVGDGSLTPLNSLNMYRSRPIICSFCTANTGAPDYDCTNSNLMQFDDGAWTDVITGISDNSENARLISAISDQCWTWLADPTSGIFSQRTDDEFVTPGTPDNQILPIHVNNYKSQFGISTGTVSSEIYIWENSLATDWTSYDTLSDGVQVDSNDSPSLIVTDDLEAYLLFYNLDNGQEEIWKRDGPLPFIGASLYFGAGVLEEKATLPFKACLPQAFALQQPLGILVIGADRPTAEMAAYSAHPYDVATTMDEGIPTGTSVSAVRWV